MINARVSVLYQSLTEYSGKKYEKPRQVEANTFRHLVDMIFVQTEMSVLRYS
jgi:hypothetical protein